MKTNKYFNASISGNVADIELDYMLLLENESYTYKDEFTALLDSLGEDNSIRVIVISNNHPNFTIEKYVEKWATFYEGEYWENNIQRVFRCFNELFLKIYSLPKSVVSVSIKPTNFTLFNLTMSADVRCVSGNFEIVNLNNNQNMINIPKGIAAYSGINASVQDPFKLIFLVRHITAESLYKRQMVDKVYGDDIEEQVAGIAQRLSQIETAEISSFKEVTGQNRIEELEASLRHENQLLLTSIRKKINK